MQSSRKEMGFKMVASKICWSNVFFQVLQWHSGRKVAARCDDIAGWREFFSIPPDGRTSHAQPAFKSSLLWQSPPCSFISQWWLWLVANVEFMGTAQGFCDLPCSIFCCIKSNQLRSQFTAEIDHKASISRHLNLTLANPPLKQLEISQRQSNIQLFTDSVQQIQNS